jgi:hypothetical protein
MANMPKYAMLFFRGPLLGCGNNDLVRIIICLNRRIARETGPSIILRRPNRLASVVAPPPRHGVGDEVSDGIGEYRNPNASSAAMADFSEAIQRFVSAPRGREAARTDFTP